TKTTGVVEEVIPLNGGLSCRVVDVGGQRSERRKWIHLFENVHVVLFVAAISEYDQVLAEDHSVSRFSESLMVFESIACSRWFTNSSLILFLNKTDLFKSKLLSSLLSSHFPDFPASTPGEASYVEAARFIASKFVDVEDRARGRSGTAGGAKKMVIHFTCATDSGSLKLVLKEVMDGITLSVLERSGLL
ncbi:hypothetical protein MNV49_007082, partial [Pseudohyphozyma bogoriensis]